jgi:hypothetical protein
MSLRRALGPILVFAAASTGCSGTADLANPDAASGNGNGDSAAQTWPGTGDAGGGADVQQGDAATQDEDATMGPGTDAALDAQADTSPDASADAAMKDAEVTDAEVKDAQGPDAPPGEPCGATTCPSGEICCEEPAPITHYCTLACVAAPGCPLPACVIPPDGGVVIDASSPDASPGIEAGFGDAAPAEAGPLTCSDLHCGRFETCCMELDMGMCAPRCVPSTFPCIVCP